MIGSLGEISFVASERTQRTFDQISKDYSARYAKHDVIGKKPVLEFIGPDSIKVQLSIRLDSSKGVVVQDEIDALTQIIDGGQEQSLLIGTKYFGQFVVKKMAEVDRVTDSRGNIRIANITLDLEESSDDRN